MGRPYRITALLAAVAAVYGPSAANFEAHQRLWWFIQRVTLAAIPCPKPASGEVFVRRVTLNLTGAPPTPADGQDTVWLLGLDHLRLTYHHQGHAERPTIMAGQNRAKELWEA